jgi:hypothetical protein
MLQEVVAAQKREFEQRAMETYVERNVDLTPLRSPLIKVILGPRRAGKSFFAVHALHAAGRFAYLNFDDERLTGLSNYDDILAAVRLVYGDTRRLLMDEIQNLPRWELFANRLQREGYDLVLTGSNAKLLSRELATHLTGRHHPMYILPFSFKEYVAEAKRELTTPEITERLNHYLETGGYPEPIVKQLDARSYLATLYESILYKDIVKRYAIRFAAGLDDLATYGLSNVAREYSFKTLSNVTGTKSDHTVKKYLDYLEEAFLFFSVSRFSFKVKEQLTSNKKLYCIDNGFIHARAFKASPDYGRLFENTVAIELKRRELQGGPRFMFWKNQQQEEVDFALRDSTRVIQLIQICAELERGATRTREVRALLKASKELRCDDLLVLTGAYEGDEEVEWFGIKRTVRFLPVQRWLLS